MSRSIIHPLLPAIAAPLVRYTKEGGLACLVLDSPSTGNCLSLPLMASLQAALAAAVADAQVEMVVLRANGRSFCSVADLALMGALVTGERQTWQAGIEGMFSLLLALHDFPKPILAAVHGNVIGGGVALLCLCDLVIAAEDAVWRLPELSLGVTPTAVLAPLMNRMGPADVNRVLYDDRVWDTASMVAFGVVTRSVPLAELDDAVSEQADAALRLPARVKAEAKALMLAGWGPAFRLRMEAARPAALATFDSTEARLHIGRMLERTRRPTAPILASSTSKPKGAAP